MRSAAGPGAGWRRRGPPRTRRNARLREEPRGAPSLAGRGAALKSYSADLRSVQWDQGRQAAVVISDWRMTPGQRETPPLKPKSAAAMLDIKAWAEYVVEWAAKDPYGFLTTVILALTPLLLASAVLSWKLAKMIEAREKEQKKKQKRQENIARAKRPKKD